MNPSSSTIRVSPSDVMLNSSRGRVRPRESALVLFVEKDTFLLRVDELLLPLLGVETTAMPILDSSPASIRLQ